MSGGSLIVPDLSRKIEGPLFAGYSIGRSSSNGIGGSLGEILLWDHSNETYLRRRHHFNTVVIRFSACYKMKVGFWGGLFLFNSNINDLLVSRFFFSLFF